PKLNVPESLRKDCQFIMPLNLPCFIKTDAGSSSSHSRADRQSTFILIRMLCELNIKLEDYLKTFDARGRHLSETKTYRLSNLAIDILNNGIYKVHTDYDNPSS
ncbi:unnamed protein product, partial [Didymodactylos carnosus]